MMVLGSFSNKAKVAYKSWKSISSSNHFSVSPVTFFQSAVRYHSAHLGSTSQSVNLGLYRNLFILKFVNACGHRYFTLKNVYEYIRINLRNFVARTFLKILFLVKPLI